MEMNIVYICTFVSLFINLYFIYKYMFHKTYILINYDRKIKSSNQVLFYKLQKQYLNNSSPEDIEDLINFLFKYYLERKKNNERNRKLGKKS